MAVAAMTKAWGGGTTCVERNLHWYSTRVDGGMCSCGAPQSGSDITGLVSPGLCGAGCAVQGGEEAGCEEGALRVERAATAEERAVCMACCSGAAPDPRAATSRGVVGTLLGFRRTARRRLRRAVCGGAQRREPDALEQYAREQYALRTRSPQLLRGAVWWWAAHRERR